MEGGRKHGHFDYPDCCRILPIMVVAAAGLGLVNADCSLDSGAVTMLPLPGSTIALNGDASAPGGCHHSSGRLSRKLAT
jgi:hypothetical protein